LYKIHKENGKIEEDLPYKPRAIKTSGRIRSKKIADEVKYFTKSKLGSQQFL